MAVFDQEVFGPVALLTTFGSDDEAVELTNATEHGLAAGVLSKDGARAIALGERIHTGNLHTTIRRSPTTNPFGGCGASGNETSIGGPVNGDEFTR